MSSFAVGLIVGQTSVLIVMALLVRFFMFADQSSSIKGLSVLEAAEKQADIEPEGPQPLDSVLEKTYYDVKSHQAETMDWVSVLIGLVINSMRQQALLNDNLLHVLNDLFASDKVPSFLDTIRVTELNLGSDFPLLNNCRVYRNPNREVSDGLEVQFDVDLKDTITLGVETRLLLNYPKPMLAYLPVSGSVSLVNFSGRALISLVTSADGVASITLSFAPNFSMEFRVSSLVGARSKLQDVPKLGQIVESTLRKKFTEALVQPNFQKFKLPVWKGRATSENPLTSRQSSVSANSNHSSNTSTNANTNVSQPANGSPQKSQIQVPVERVGEVALAAGSAIGTAPIGGIRSMSMRRDTSSAGSSNAVTSGTDANSLLQDETKLRERPSFSMAHN